MSTSSNTLQTGVNMGWERRDSKRRQGTTDGVLNEEFLAHGMRTQLHPRHFGDCLVPG